MGFWRCSCPWVVCFFPVSYLSFIQATNNLNKTHCFAQLNFGSILTVMLSVSYLRWVGIWSHLPRNKCHTIEERLDYKIKIFITFTQMIRMYQKWASEPQDFLLLLFSVFLFKVFYACFSSQIEKKWYWSVVVCHSFSYYPLLFLLLVHWWLFVPC